MNLPQTLAGFLPVILALSAPLTSSAAAQGARVTRIVREVKLLPGDADPRAAAVNDRVPEDTAVRTGDRSRSELTFADLTIARLGANTFYRSNRAGRSVDLGGGSVLLCVPKDSGGANINGGAVSVAITGTTLILEANRSGRSKLLVLEGSARLSLVKHPAQRRNVHGGQMLDVPAGATTLPFPTDIDLRRTLREHPLLANFPPLPSQDLILAAADGQVAPNEPVYQGQPVAGPPVSVGPVFPGIILPPILLGGGHGNVGRPPGQNNLGNTNNPGHGKGDSHTSSGAVKRPPSRGKTPPPSSSPIIR